MTIAATSSHSNNIVLGAGRLFFDALDSSGNPTGERYMGDSPEFSVTVNATKVEDWSSDAPVAEKLLSIATEVTRQCQIQVKDVSIDNLALFLLGDSSPETQTATPVTGEAINNVQTGRYYQLGVTTSSPSGVRDVTSVSVTDASSTSYVEGTDYEVDLTTARIYIMPSGSIASGTNLLIDYTPTAGSRDRIVTNNLGAKFGALRYIADNTAGTNRDLYAPYVQLMPNGSFDLKSRQNVQQLTFDAEFLKHGANAAVYIDGQAVA